MKCKTEAKVSKIKPWWWKPLWIITLLLAIASGAAGFFLLDVSLARVAVGLALTFLGMGVAYYIRVRPSMKVNRAIYIVFGGGVAWFIVFFGSVFILKATGSPFPYLEFWIFYILFFIAPWIIGAVIGDWIGKRRNYILPLSP